MSMMSTRSSSSTISSSRAPKRRRLAPQQSTRSSACCRRPDAHGRPRDRRASDRLGSDPVERDVLGRIQRVLELEAVRVNREDRRLSPGDKLRPGAGFAAWSIHQLRILPGQAGRSDDRLGPGLELADDLDAPMAEIGGNLIGDIGPLVGGEEQRANITYEIEIGRAHV